MRRVLCGLLTIAALAACTPDKATPANEAPFLRGSGELRVLAGSELADLQPILDRAKEATGVSVRLAYTGTLDGVEAVVNGSAAKAHDAVWFASNRYLDLNPAAAGRTGTATKIATSPVVLGLRPDVARELGWDRTRPTWNQIAEAAGQKKLTYAMTNPAASNSGFSALVSVAAALAGSGEALTAEQVAALTPRLRAFFAGQALTAGSSGWLAEAFAGRGSDVDGMINYESVLLSSPTPLTMVYPADGVVSADYPLTLLTGANDQARTNYLAVTDYLRRPSVQREIMTRTWRRPAVAEVPRDARFGGAALVELPFPAKLEVANRLIAAFGDSLRRPARTIYVLDTSGSMRGSRMDGLKGALVGLTGADQSLAGQFARFNGREQVIMQPFATTPGPARRFDVPETDFGPVLTGIRSYAAGLQPAGNTAIYEGLIAAYQQIEPDDRYTSIVLLTDGELTTGRTLAQFKAFHAALVPALKSVPIFTILFGEGNAAEMNEVATLTGGRAFDARRGELGLAFREIRGYQ